MFFRDMNPKGLRLFQCYKCGVQITNLLRELESDSNMNKALKETFCVWWNVHPFSSTGALPLLRE